MTLFPDAPAPRSRQPLAAFAFVMAGAALVLTTYLVWDNLRYHPGPAPVTAKPVVARGDLMDIEKTTIAIYEAAAPSVVHITTLVRVQTDWWTATDVPEGTGSGFVWDASGYIVTNHHVVAEAKSGVLVRLATDEEYRARIVGAREDLDIAVLKIEPEAPLQPVMVGESDSLKVGQMALAIGNPFGLDRTLTTGVISALDRTIETMFGTKIQGVIQVDNAINPGNSGGPLLDSAGRVIGMNTAITSPTRASAGIGFAVPIDIINRAVPRIISHGSDENRPVIGVETSTVPLPNHRGLAVLVQQVMPGSGAEEAGIRPTRITGDGRLMLGDIIVSVDGHPVDHIGDVWDALDGKKPGEVVHVGLYRSGGTTTVDVPLRAAKDLPATAR